MNVKEFKDDKTEFRQWTDKLVNACSATFTSSRIMFKMLNKKLEAERQELEELDVYNMWETFDEGVGKLFTREDLDSMGDQLYYLLVEKTTGESLN